MAQEGLFSGDQDNVIHWLTVGGIVLAVAAAVVILYVMTRRPDWRVTYAARWILLVGLFVLPIGAMLMGNVVGLHNSKQSCSQCHTMDPWISDMKDPKSKTLAARHYQNRWINEDQCYTCHSGYGLAGNIDAKLGGLRHVQMYYFTGVPEVIKIHKPFPVATCLHCHAEAASYLKVDQHVDPEFKPKILSGEMSCLECHESPHPRKKK